MTATLKPPSGVGTAEGACPAGLHPASGSIDHTQAKWQQEMFRPHFCAAVESGGVLSIFMYRQ